MPCLSPGKFPKTIFWGVFSDFYTFSDNYEIISFLMEVHLQKKNIHLRRNLDYDVFLSISKLTHLLFKVTLIFYSFVQFFKQYGKWSCFQNVDRVPDNSSVFWSQKNALIPVS